jgi:hypothetical protein
MIDWESRMDKIAKVGESIRREKNEVSDEESMRTKKEFLLFRIANRKDEVSHLLELANRCMCEDIPIGIGKSDECDFFGTYDDVGFIADGDDRTAIMGIGLQYDGRRFKGAYIDFRGDYQIDAELQNTFAEIHTMEYILDRFADFRDAFLDYIDSL